jgi:AcrR family transcriptional regulator
LSSQAQDVKRSGADTRQRILAVAVELFSTQGYAGTSIRDITVAMGMTKASLYYYFESKEQILDAVTAPLRSEMEDLLARASVPPTPSSASVLADMVEMLSRHALLLRTVFDDPSALKRGAGGEDAQRRVRGFEALLAASSAPVDLLRARCALGAVHAGVLRTVAGDSRLDEPLRGDRALRLLEGREHALDAQSRREVVEAALRALGGDSAFPATCGE